MEKAETIDKSRRYLFPNFVASAMSRVDQRTQFEAGMMSMTFMIIGMLLTGIYMIFYTNFTFYFKLMTGVNLFFGMIFMASNLVSQYQMYCSYLDALAFQEDLKKMDELNNKPVQDSGSTDLKGGN